MGKWTSIIKAVGSPGSGLLRAPEPDPGPDPNCRGCEGTGVVTRGVFSRDCGCGGAR